MAFIYLIRHGIATPHNAEGDHLRPLTAEGKTKTAKVAQKLHNLGLNFDRLLTSPLVRAQQTAEIVGSYFDQAPIGVVDFLAPQGSFNHWEIWLNQNNQLNSIALIGHEPDLSTWAEIMVWGEVSGNIALKKAGIIGLITPINPPIGGNCTLFLLVPPKILTGEKKD